MSEPRAGDLVEYRALAGDRWVAVVLAVRPGGLVDLDVVVPGSAERVRLMVVRWGEGSAPGAAGPGRSAP